MIPFAKGHGLGNDYLVLDAADLPDGRKPPPDPPPDPPLSAAAIVALCDRHRGVGGDGILLAVPSARAEFGVRIFNPDGSEAEKSGNGLRIFAAWLREFRHAPDAFTVETRGGIVRCECHVTNGRVVAVTVEMGRASFVASDVPMAGVAGEAVAVPIALPDGLPLVVTAVSVGNPHCVVFRDVLDEAECRRLGPVLERHAAFPQRTNVQLVRPLARDRIAILVWERGAGYTLASGSSSCAAAAAAVRGGRVDCGRVVVEMPGGTLVVHVRADWSLRLEGDVALVYTGTLGPALARLLRA